MKITEIFKFSKTIKTILIILGIIIATPVIIFIALVIYGVLNPDYQMECLESSYCKKGVVVKIHGDIPEEINKDTCLKYNGEWKEKTEYCIFPDYEYSFDKASCLKAKGNWYQEAHYCQLPNRNH